MNDLNVDKSIEKSIDEELELTLQLLKESFTSKDNERHKQINQKLHELAQNPFRHIQILSKALVSESQEVTPKLNTSIAIYLKNIIQMTQKRFSVERQLEILQFLIQAIIFKTFPSPSLLNLYQIILNMTSTNAFLSNVNYIKDILDYLHNTLTQSPKEQFLVQGLVIVTLLNVFIQSKSINCESINDVIPIVINIIDHVISVSNIYINSNSGINISYLKIMKVVYDSLYSLQNKIKTSPNASHHYSNLYSKYSNHSLEIIKLNISNSTSENIIYITDNQDLNDSINTLKGSVLQFLSSLIHLMDSSKINDECVMLFSDLVKIIIKSFGIIINSNLSLVLDLINTSPNEKLHCLVYNMLIFLLRVLVRNPIKQEFSSLVNEFIVSILFPLIVSTSKDVYQIKESGEEYYKFMNDLIAFHQMKTYRTAAVLLLHKISETYIDSFNFMTSFALQYMNYYLKDAIHISLSKSNSESSNETETVIDIKNYYFLTMYLNQNSILASMSIERKIDFGLLIMIIVNDKAINNKQCREMLHSILFTYSNLFFTSNHPLVIDKLCLFYFYYLNELFDKRTEDNHNYLSSAFSFLLNIIVDNKKYDGLVFQSANTLIELLNKAKDNKNMMFADIMSTNIEKMILLIEESEVYLFFDIFILMISRQIVSLQQVQCRFLTIITERILKDIKNSIVYKNKDSRLLDKCFVILIIFLEKNNQASIINAQSDNNIDTIMNRSPNFITTIESIEKIILPIVQYIHDPYQISFEDNIIDLMKALITYSQSLTNFNTSLVPSLQLVCDKNKMLSEKEFNYLSTFFMHDTDGVYTQLYQNDILNLIYLGYQYDNEEGVILALMLSLQLLSKTKSIDNAYLSSLLLKGYQNLITIQSNEIASKQSLENQFIQLLSVSVIALSMITKPIATLAFLESSNYFISFLIEINSLIQPKLYLDRLFKIIILGLCALINNKENIKKLIMMNKLTQLLYLLFKLCVRHKKNEKTNLIQLTKDDLQCKFVSQSANERYFSEFDIDMGIHNNKVDDGNGKALNDLNDDDSDNEYSAYQSHYDDDFSYDIYIRQCYMEMIQNIFLLGESIDEYKAFSLCLNKLDVVYSQYFNEILSNEDKADLNELIHIKKIDIRYNDMIIKAPRRIITVKRENSVISNNTNPNNLNTNNDGQEKEKSDKDIRLFSLGNEDNYIL